MDVRDLDTIRGGYIGASWEHEHTVLVVAVARCLYQPDMGWG